MSSILTPPRPVAPHPFDDLRPLYCESCGYGVVADREPPACPACRRESWTETPTPAQRN